MGRRATVKEQKRKHRQVVGVHHQIPVAQYKVLERLAEYRGCPLSQLYIEAIQEYLNVLPKALREKFWQDIQQEKEGQSVALPLDIGSSNTSSVKRYGSNTRQLPWMPIYAYNLLHGSTAQMPLEAKFIWEQLLKIAWCDRCFDGILRYGPNQPITRKQLARKAGCTLGQFNKAIEIYKKDITRDTGLPRVQEWEDGTLVLTNVAAHQAALKGKRQGSDNSDSQEPETQAERELRERGKCRQLAKIYPGDAEDALKEHQEAQDRLKEHRKRIDKVYTKAPKP